MNNPWTKPFMSPCQGCTKRCAEPNCHANCEAYVSFSRENDRVNKERHLAKQANTYFGNFAVRVKGW